MYKMEKIFGIFSKINIESIIFFNGEEILVLIKKKKEEEEEEESCSFVSNQFRFFE
jgi:hypothetical protein